MDNEAVFPLDEPINLEYLYSYTHFVDEDMLPVDLRRCQRCFGTGIFEGMDADEAKRCVSCKGDGWLPC